jgi:hypothetical protein
MLTTTQQYVRIPKEEYAQLKKLQKHFESFWGYMEYLQSIKDSRRDVRRGKVIAQEKLFQKLEL